MPDRIQCTCRYMIKCLEDNKEEKIIGKNPITIILNWLAGKVTLYLEKRKSQQRVSKVVKGTVEVREF